MTILSMVCDGVSGEGLDEMHVEFVVVVVAVAAVVVVVAVDSELLLIHSPHPSISFVRSGVWRVKGGLGTTG